MECKNCKANMVTESSFCHNCGSKIIKNRLNFKNLLEHFIETYLNYDNKLLQTIISLFTKPEIVIESYINGTRKRFINPVNFFGVSLTLSGIYFFFFKNKLIENLDFSDLYSQNSSQEKLNQAILNFTLEYNSLIYFGIIPALGLISLAVFFNKKYNLTEHIVIYLYSMSLFSIISVLVTIAILLIVPNQYLILSAFIYASMFIYHGYILKRIFNLRIKQLILKTLLFIPLFFIFYGISSILLFAFIMLTGDFSLSDFAPKK